MCPTGEAVDEEAVLPLSIERAQAPAPKAGQTVATIETRHVRPGR